jgi:hypothetical protein
MAEKPAPEKTRMDKEMRDELRALNARIAELRSTLKTTREALTEALKRHAQILAEAGREPKQTKKKK